MSHSSVFRKLLLSILLVSASCNLVYADPIENVEFVLRGRDIFVKSAEGLTQVNMADFLNGLSELDLYRLMLSQNGFVFSDSEGSYSINVDLPAEGNNTKELVKKWVYKSLLAKAEEIVLTAFFKNVQDMISSDIDAVKEEGKRLYDDIMKNDILRPIYLYTAEKIIPQSSIAFKRASRALYKVMSGVVRDVFVLSKAVVKSPKFFIDSFNNAVDDEEREKTIKGFVKSCSRVLLSLEEKIKEELERKERG